MTAATARPKLTARQMNAALWQHFSGRYAMLTEVSARPAQAGDRTRRIDVLLLRALGGGIERIAVEVKVSRADFLADVRDPAKQAPWRELAHRHAYAVPEGLVGEKEIPAGSGLLVVRDQYPRVRWAVRAKRPVGHDPGDLPLPILMDAFYRAGRGEAQLKGHGVSSRAASGGEEELRAAVARLTAENGRLVDQVERVVEQRKQWQQAFAAVGNPPCATCGQPLRPTVGSRRYRLGEWEHAKDIDAAGCDLLRRADAIRANDARPVHERTDERYLYVRGPEPADLPAG